MTGTQPKRLIFDAKLKAAKDYWLRKLEGVAPGPEYFLDVPRPGKRSSTRQSVTRSIDPGWAKEVAGFGDGSPLSIYCVFLTALKICLSRCSGDSRIIAGSPPLLQHADGSQGPNLVPILDNVEGTASFTDIFQQIRENAASAYENQIYPFERLISELGIATAETRSPLFNVIARMEGLHGEMLDTHPDWILTVRSSSAEISLEVEYRPDLFERQSMERLAMHIATLVESAMQRPESPVSELELLSVAERNQLLVEWSETLKGTQVDQNVHERFDAQAWLTPDATALIIDGEHLSYRCLSERSNQLARYLREEGVAPESRVAVCMERSAELFVSILAVLKAGGAYVPLDVDNPPERLRFLCDDCHAVMLLTQDELLEHFQSGPGKIFRPRTEWSKLARHSGQPINVRSDRANLAYVIYTSGSTGTPKGVQIEHSGLSNLVHWQIEAFGLGPGAHVLQFASPAFDASVSEIFTTLCSGATLQTTRQPARNLEELLQAGLITTITLPPSLIETLDPNLVPSLRTLVSAGDSCPVHLASRWCTTHRFINAYGPTETTVCATLTECHPEPLQQYAPIGRPLPGQKVYVLDDGQRPVAVKVNGMLYIGGTGVSRGYLGRPELTAEKFVPDPFSQRAGARLYASGDVVRYLPDGNLEFVGRRDHQVKVHGYRIELGEIEAALRRQDGIGQAVVTVRNEEPNGKRLIAYVVESPGTKATSEDELWTALRREIPTYMMPSLILRIAELPFTHNGKVDRNALPAPETIWQQKDYEPPVTEMEIEIAAMWKDLLKVERVGRNDDFFELGGHSLLGLQLITQIHARFGIELPAQDVFMYSTLSGLAEFVENILWAAQEPQGTLHGIEPEGGRL
jgi:amino acid adenylation domain-containing protein